MCQNKYIYTYKLRLNQTGPIITRGLTPDKAHSHKQRTANKKPGPLSDALLTHRQLHSTVNIHHNTCTHSYPQLSLTQQKQQPDPDAKPTVFCTPPALCHTSVNDLEQGGRVVVLDGRSAGVDHLGLEASHCNRVGASSQTVHGKTNQETLSGRRSRPLRSGGGGQITDSSGWSWRRE